MDNVKRLLRKFLLHKTSSTWLIDNFYFITGSREERVLGSSIAVLLCIQLGAGSESEAVFKTLKPHLITVIQDQTAGSAVRGSVRNLFK